MNTQDLSLKGALPEPSPLEIEESERLAIVRSFQSDALEDDAELQAIVEFAAKLCDAPVSLVTLLEADRQRFLAREGLEERETPRDIAFCSLTLGQGELLEIQDATADPRVANNPLVTGEKHVRYYAGQPLLSSEGASLGTLCVLDTEVRDQPLSDLQREGLAVLAQAAMRRLSARRENLQSKRTIAEREDRLRRMIDGVPAIAWSADAEGNFDYFNSRWEEATGQSPPKVADDWRPFVHPDDAEAALAAWGESFRNGEEFEVEYRLKQADGSWIWVLSMAVPVAERDGDAVRWFGTLTDIDETRNALNERDLLARELSHRIKNIFAVVTGLIALKSRRAPESADFAVELTDLLRALGRAHEFVQPDALGAQECLKQMLEALFTPYQNADGEARVRVAGPNVETSQRAATPFALVFHELATNSAKYGALSNDTGHITLDIHESGDDLTLTWTEHGGPPVEEPPETGFGSRLVEMSITGQLQGTWQRRFPPEGMVMTLTVPKAAIAR
ncbi:sensor histidine kinase [Aurantiacibacter aquimixticola]|uniref:sensor histidine kinase n=1 Tax=Aurantiacibacter aquimixticola TaxID=1958945 RepID=UPI0010583EBD|nr:PAS domain-containing protein [Aurantiacibacter aquimixticola]